jgi:hypothetical protein
MVVTVTPDPPPQSNIAASVELPLSVNVIVPVGGTTTLPVISITAVKVTGLFTAEVGFVAPDEDATVVDVLACATAIVIGVDAAF